MSQFFLCLPLYVCVCVCVFVCVFRYFFRFLEFLAAVYVFVAVRFDPANILGPRLSLVLNGLHPLLRLLNER